MDILCFIEDFSFDFKYGTNTMSPVRLCALNIKSENKIKGFKYRPTRAKPFKKLMTTLDFPDDSVFVDFGAGKGRVILLASQYRFKRVVGIEFSPQLCKEARKNFAIFKKKSKTFDQVEIIESDVVDYEIGDDENVFFLFNPFNGTVMNRLLRNLAISLEKKKRKIWLIYNHPVYRDIIESQDIFYKLDEFILCGSDFVIYTNDLS